jgi:3-isopropylmalate dehydratase small subunit
MKKGKTVSFVIDDETKYKLKFIEGSISRFFRREVYLYAGIEPRVEKKSVTGKMRNLQKNKVTIYLDQDTQKIIEELKNNMAGFNMRAFFNAIVKKEFDKIS